MKNFSQNIQENYNFSGEHIDIGVALYENEIFSDTHVSIPLSTLNRHGLITGATGTGKTKTIQKLLERLSDAGVPSVMMDIKGDISGLSMPGEYSEKLQKYIDKFGDLEWQARGFPVEFFSLLNEGGAQVRSTVSEFGPFLFARVLGLSSVQTAALTIIFKYADDHGLLLVDLEDLETLLSFLATDGKNELASYGQISQATIQVIMRQIIVLKSQGASQFFGEKSLDMSDLMRVDDEGKGQINIIRLMNSLRYPQLFSTMMIQILTELFGTLPEIGDISKPKLVVIIDEAHLLFRDLPNEILSEFEVIIKLIRSKGVSVIFCTQNPMDIPEIILSQLGLKIQHALRAFTAKDNESIKKMAKNFPVSEFYDIEKNLTTLGTGEAFVTTIGENGNPTPLVMTKIFPPESRMDTITDAELASFLSISPIFASYKNPINPESAQEILAQKMMMIQSQKREEEAEKARIMTEKERRKNPTMTDAIVESVTKTFGKEIARSVGTKIGGRRMGSIGAEIARGILGSIFK
ncbi:hypothetical protein BLM37_02435 [Candidatus Gracilibacteria bacterium GN02-873]|nr:hypothetical protein BLM37_02435 [Candidatus Gracilibacteria bacterium GN02-873]